MKEQILTQLGRPNKTMFYDHIAEYIADENVLDIGCAQHNASLESTEEWMHGLIKKEADHVLGVDLLEEEVTKLQEQGHNAVQGDAEDLHLDKKFDVIFAGELIEHLENFAGFFNSVRRHLKSDGKLIITTPNAMSLRWPFERLLNRDFINDEHTCWFDRITLIQLMKRFGMAPKHIGYARTSRLIQIRGLTDVIVWGLETIPPARISQETLIMVAELE